MKQTKTLKAMIRRVFYSQLSDSENREIIDEPVEQTTWSIIKQSNLYANGQLSISDEKRKTQEPKL